MDSLNVDSRRIRAAWEGRLSVNLAGFGMIMPQRNVFSLMICLVMTITPRATFADAPQLEHRSQYFAPEANTAPVVDGIADEIAWEKAEWQQLSHRWLGPEYTSDDFAGRVKIVWTKQKIYILAEIVDDVLFDSHRDPLLQYWDDDCLEIFLDEDFSGGNHQYNHNAFAYHVSLDNQVIDIGRDAKPHSYSHHVESRWQQRGGKVVWELAIDVYADTYDDESDQNIPVTLSAGKILGLMFAYCDNDGSEIRENFIGSEAITNGPKDRGWIDAGTFGALILVDDKSSGDQ